MADSLLMWPDWRLPTGVQSFVTTRHGGFSKEAHASFNLATHVEDEAICVQRNRELLQQMLEQRAGQSPLQMQWLEQVHGTKVHEVKSAVTSPPPPADALYTRECGIVLSVLTADCLPVLFCSADGKEIAVAHAGWRGLCNGVLEATLAHFNCAPASVHCWLGPAIGVCHFEVGSEVRDAFIMLSRLTYMDATRAAFVPCKEKGKWMCDLYALARVRLIGVGVTQITGQPQCVVCKHDDYYSYRQAAVTGRFATGIVQLA